MPFHRLSHSGELDVFDATLYFSGGFDFIAAHRPVVLDFVAAPCSVGQPMFRNTPPPSVSQFTKAEKIVRDQKRSKQPISRRAKLATFVNSIFRQTKCKPKSTHTLQAPKPLKRRLPLFPNITKIEMRYYDSCKNGINAIYLVHEAKLNKKSTTNFSEFVEYKGVPNKGGEIFFKDHRIWLNKGLSSTEGRRSFRKPGDQVEPDHGYCNQRQSACSSDLFELENYKL